MTQTISDTPEWGRILICGGTLWEYNGRKDRPKVTEGTDITEPARPRAFANIQATKVIAGPSANYAAILDVHGAAYLIGAFPSAAYGAHGLISHMDPVKVTPRMVGSAHASAKFVTGACARSHCLLVDDQGEVWGCGNNSLGQLGLPVSESVGTFTRISGPWTSEPESRIVAVSAGHGFTLFLTASGQVYAAGSSEFGQLGNGRTGKRILKKGKEAYDIEAQPLLVSELRDQRITHIASGNHHSLALDDNGHVYAWGHNGYCRLGLEDQDDRLLPTLVPQLAGKDNRTTAKAIVCGPTSSVVIDRSGQFLLAGKWKVTGEGGNGAPFKSFKPLSDMNIRATFASLGGCTHFVVAPAEEGDVTGLTKTYGFGQGVLYGELALGVEKLSVSKPTVLDCVHGYRVIDIGAGAFCTFLILRPDDAIEEYPLYPDTVDSASGCIACFAENDQETAAMVSCDKCDEAYHFTCMDPPIVGLPAGEWLCPECRREGEGGLDEPYRPSSVWAAAKQPGWQDQPPPQTQLAPLGTASAGQTTSAPSSKRGRLDDEAASVTSDRSSRSKRSKI